MKQRFIHTPILVPVVELEPGAYGDVAMPPHPVSDEQIRRHWQDSLAQSKLGHLIAVKTRSWLVDFAQVLNDSEFPTVLKNELDYVELGQSDSDLMHAIAGGYGLFDGDEPVILPQCCCGFGDLNAWRTAAAYHGASPTKVWIGHPQLDLSYAAPNLVLADEDEPHADRLHVIVDASALAIAVDHAELLVQSWLPRVTDEVKRLGYHYPAVVARALLGLTN
jgi:hypothetical protein